MKKIIVFSLPIGIAGMIGTITSQMDGLFISMMKSTEEYAVYVVAAVEVPLIGVVLSSISAAILPEMRARIASGNLKAGGEMFVIAAKRTACLTLPLMCFLALWSREFISFMYGEQYLAAAPIFTVYLLYFLTRICYTGPVFAALGMGKYILIRTLVSCGLNAIFTYFFILWIGSIGAAIGTILSGMLIMVLSIFPVLSKKIGIPKRELYPIITVIKLLVVGFMSAAISKIVVDMVFSIKSVEYADHLDVALPLFSHNVFRLGAGGVLFFAIYVFLVLLTTRSEYDWLIIKLKIKARVIFWKRKGT
jgi:O-antigen/teichoic acid export membrane protein